MCIEDAWEAVEEWSGAQAINSARSAVYEDEETRRGWQEVEATVLGRLVQVRCLVSAASSNRKASPREPARWDAWLRERTGWGGVSAEEGEAGGGSHHRRHRRSGDGGASRLSGGNGGAHPACGFPRLPRHPCDHAYRSGYAYDSGTHTTPERIRLRNPGGTGGVCWGHTSAVGAASGGRHA